MSQLLLYRDAEGAAIGHVKAEYAARGQTARVGTSVSPTDATLAVRISRAGGPPDLVLDKPMLTVSVWHSDSTIASEEASRILGYLRRMPGLKFFNVVGGLMNYPDPDTNKPRYQFTIQIGLKAYTENTEE